MTLAAIWPQSPALPQTHHAVPVHVNFWNSHRLLEIPFSWHHARIVILLPQLTAIFSLHRSCLNSTCRPCSILTISLNANCLPYRLRETVGIWNFISRGWYDRRDVGRFDAFESRNGPDMPGMPTFNRSSHSYEVIPLCCGKDCSEFLELAATPKMWTPLPVIRKRQLS